MKWFSKVRMLCLVMAPCAMMAACGSDSTANTADQNTAIQNEQSAADDNAQNSTANATEDNSSKDSASESTGSSSATDAGSSNATDSGSSSAADSNTATGSTTTTSTTDTTKGTGSTDKSSRLISDQTFTTSFASTGEVTFASYAPDTSTSPYADVTFELQKDGQTFESLQGMAEYDIRDGKTFNKVEAVSFPDYNSDGQEDIITICSYTEDGTTSSEVRIYQGCADKTFLLDQQLTADTNSALAEKTVQGVLDYLGAGKSGDDATSEDWKQAYIQKVVDTASTNTGYTYELIYIDDDAIPELAEIGDCEAAGTTILNYSGGAVHETMLSRTFFTYIEKGNLLCNSEGNMDIYYDIVYSIVDGQMTQVAKGNYGALDGSAGPVDEAGYQYQWNGATVDKATYDQQLNAVYDTTKAKNGGAAGAAVDADSIVEAIKNF